GQDEEQHRVHRIPRGDDHDGRRHANPGKEVEEQGGENHRDGSGPLRPAVSYPAGCPASTGSASPRGWGEAAMGTPVLQASWLPIGRRRMRLPVAWKIALHSAGANGGTPGSPTPLGGVSMPCGTMWTRVSVGDSMICASWKSSKLRCWTRPSLRVI